MNDYEWPTLPPRHLSVAGAVALHLEQMISTQFSPGDKLPTEREIADKLGVSRTSVREALHELTLKGITERKSGRGTIVKGTGSRPNELFGTMQEAVRRRREVVDLREVCEPAVAARAAERATVTDLARLQEILQRSSSDLSAEESTALDEQFHAALARSAQNPLLATLIELIQSWLHAYRLQTHQSAHSRELSIQGHQEILRCVQMRDKAAAGEAMLRHIHDTSQSVDERNL